MTVTIEPMRPGDFPAVLALLERSGLPTDGLADHQAATLAAYVDGRITGSAALEVYGASGLLRSVAVDADWRGQGLGRRLTQAALDLARRRGIGEIFLLTETAAQFFPRFGFRPVARADVPAPVQASVEFTTVCPDSALVMRAEL